MTTVELASTPRSASARRLALTTGRVLARAALVALLAAVVGALTVLLVLPGLTRAVPMTVLTGSMTPTIPAGSMVLVRPVDPATLEVGDVATYQTAPGVDSYITHRIVGLDRSATPPAFVFQGDANRGPDLKPIPPGAIRGEVWFHVPYLGNVKNALHGPAGMGLLAMLLLGAYALIQVGSALRDHRTRTHAEHSNEQPTGEPNRAHT